MNVEQRKKLERRVVAAILSDGLKAGYFISVDNGEESFEPSTDEHKILSQMFATDEEYLRFWKNGKRIGSVFLVGYVFLVYGNDGWDVVCDYSVNLEPIMNGVNAIVEQYR